MQDSNTSRMDHNVYELLHYASNILTLNPGDIISGGSPAGTNIERAEPRLDACRVTAQCSIRRHRCAEARPWSRRAPLRTRPDDAAVTNNPFSGGRQWKEVPFDPVSTLRSVNLGRFTFKIEPVGCPRPLYFSERD
jgi:hypothetical protein